MDRLLLVSGKKFCLEALEIQLWLQIVQRTKNPLFLLSEPSVLLIP